MTLAIRPEQVVLSDQPDEASLQGALLDAVYIGTDTHYRIRLGSEELFTVRVQNTRGRSQQFQSGDRVGIVLDPATVQLLRD